MLEVDVVIFIVIGVDSESIGFNFLRQIDLSYTYFSSSDAGSKWTGLRSPGGVDKVLELPQSGSLLIASVDYDVDIVNASGDRVAVLARPHLTTLSGTPASFLAGGEVVFKVTGNIGGNIKPYPFGTSVAVTPTMLRTPGSDGKPRIHIEVEANRTSILEVLVAEREEGDVIFDKLSVTSQAVLDLGQTLILSGLSQRESRTSTSGVPILKDIPLLKFLFSNKTTVETNTSIIMLLTPRDPAYRDARNQNELTSFIEMRRAFINAQQGTAEDMRKFEEQYPNWRDIPPNRFASHFFLSRVSELYRRVSKQNLIDENLDLDLLGDFK